MSNLKAKELLAEKFNDYMERKSVGLDGMTIGIEERSGDTVEDSIYNKLYARQIEINKLDQKYVKENKEIDITKANKRLKTIEKDINKTKTALNNFTKSYNEELEKLQDQELQHEHSVMRRAGIIEKYNKLLNQMDFKKNMK